MVDGIRYTVYGIRYGVWGMGAEVGRIQLTLSSPHFSPFYTICNMYATKKPSIHDRRLSNSSIFMGLFILVKSYPHYQ